MTVNVYDFDKTIFSKDSSVEFYKFCLKKKPSILKYIFVQLLYFFLYVFCIVDKTTFKSKFFIFLKSFKNIDQVVIEFWDKNKSRINSWYKEKHSDNDVVISASPSFLLRPICTELGIKNLIATEVNSRTGVINSQNCYGEEKVRLFKEKFPDTDINQFYSDSYSDQPMANIAKEPYLVKHNQPVKWNEYQQTPKEIVKHKFLSKEFLAYFIIGALSVINTALIAFVFSLFLIKSIAFLLAFIISLIISFFLCSFFVFKEKLSFSAFGRYFLSCLPSFLIYVSFLVLFGYVLHFSKPLIYVFIGLLTIPLTFWIFTLVLFNSDWKENYRKIRISQICFDAGVLIVLIFAVNILLASLGFVVNITISWAHLLISFIFASLILFLVNGRKRPLSFVIVIITVLTIFIVSATFIGEFYDASWDGNTYYKFEIGMLRLGWNPLKQYPAEAVAAYLTDKQAMEHPFIDFIEGYCKGLWFFGASLYDLTGNIETGKCFNMIFIIALAFVSYGALRRKNIHPIISVSLSLVAAFNPVLLSQMYTFYVDGTLYATLTILLIALLIWLLDEKFDRKYVFVIIGASMVLCGNIKFTGLLIGACFCVANFFGFAIKTFVSREKKYTVKEYIIKLLPTFFVFVLIGAVTILWGGLSTYITNLYRHYTLGYPITGVGAIDIMNNNSPFQPGTNGLINFFKSLFARVDNFAYLTGETAQLKVPFSVSSHELGIIAESTDIRLSGFGPLFSGVAILSFGLFVYECIALKKNFENLVLLLNFVVCIIFILAIQESWWARYAHYVYIATILTLYAAIKEGFKIKPLLIIGLITIAILFVNNSFSFSIIKYNLEFTAEKIKNYSAVKDIATDIYVYNYGFKGCYFNMIDFGFNISIDPYVESRYGWDYAEYFGTKWVPINDYRFI